MRTNLRTGRSRARRSWVVSLVAVVAVLAAGCSGGASAGAQGSSPKSFTFVMPESPVSLDIAKNFYGTTMQIAALVTEKLERISPSGKLSPGLATHVAQPNPTTLVYTIRKGVKFSDGTPLTAKDVAWSVQHMAGPKSGSQAAGNVPSFVSATATGPLQVTVKLKHPDPTARKSLAVISFIQEAKFAKAHPKALGSPAAVPVGTGPYKVSSDTAQAVTLTRNTHYWGPKPPVNKVTFKFIPKDSTARLALRSGSIDGSLIRNRKTADQWKKIPGTTLYSLPSLTSIYLALNTRSGPTSDVHVRKAIAYSINTAGVLKAGFGKYATLLKAATPAGLIADVAPSKQAAQQLLNSLPQYHFDLGKAKSQLAQSAYPNGFSLTIPYVNGAPWSELTVKNLQQNMKQLGVTITPKSETLDQHTAALYAHKNLGVLTLRSVAPIPDPKPVLGQFTGKENIRKNGFNLANWSTPQVEKAQNQLTRSTNTTARWKATKTLLKDIANKVPYLPLFSPDQVLVLGNGFSFAKKQNLFDLEFNGTWIFDLTSG